MRTVGRYKEQGIFLDYSADKDYTEEEIAKIKKKVNKNKKDRRTKNFPHIKEEPKEPKKHKVPIESKYVDDEEAEMLRMYEDYDLDEIERQIKLNTMMTGKVKLRVELNKYVDLDACVESIYRTTEAMFVSVKDKIRAIPATVATQLEGLDAKDIQKILINRIDECLNDLVNYERKGIRRACLQKANVKPTSAETTTENDN